MIQVIVLERKNGFLRGLVGGVADCLECDKFRADRQNASPVSGPRYGVRATFGVLGTGVALVRVMNAAFTLSTLPVVAAPAKSTNVH
jgi:hypothetical protein